MWSPGNCPQPENQLESKIPVLSHRKRSIDLVRQAQFAACSYLGFDPYEEKHRSGFLRQVSASDGSVPLELHLHHHHHHHCREHEDVLKRPPHIQSSIDSPLGVGSLLSICDHVQFFQDAWQSHGRLDEKSQKFLLHGSLIKRDATYAGFEGGMPLSSDKKDSTDRPLRSFTESYWNGGALPASTVAQSNTTVNEHQQMHGGAKVSHWECRVVQEDQTTKGFGVGIKRIEKGQVLPSTDDVADVMSRSADFGWKPASKLDCSNYQSPSNNFKAERNTFSSNVPTNNNNDTFMEPVRKAGPTVTKRKKTLNDVDMNYDHTHSGSDSILRKCTEAGTFSQQKQIQTASDNAKRLLGLSPRNSLRQFPKNLVQQDECNFLVHDKNTANHGMMSVHTDMSGISNSKHGLASGCDECTCQQSVSINQGRQSHMTICGLAKGLKDELESSNAKTKQHDPREKIIILDDSETGDGYNSHALGNSQEKSLCRKQHSTVSNVESDSLASLQKITEEHNGKFVWNEPMVKRGDCLSSENASDKPLLVKSSEENLVHDVPMEKGQRRGTYKDSYSNEKMKKLTVNDAFNAADKAIPKDSSPIVHSRKVSLVDESDSPVTRMNKSMTPETKLLSKNSPWECTLALESAMEAEECSSRMLSCKDDIVSKSQGRPNTHKQGESDKFKHDFSKKKLEPVKADNEIPRNFSASSDKNSSNLQGDRISKRFIAAEENEKRSLAFELEARLAAEEIEQKYETSAEATEDQLMQLLEERTKLHRRFDEELEQKELERIHLHKLFEQEKLKSEAAKKELQELKEKFASLINNIPMSPRVPRDDLHRLTSPKFVQRTSEKSEQRRIEKKELLQISVPNDVSEFMRVPTRMEQAEGNILPMLENNTQFKSHEPGILQQVRRQEIQLKTAEDAFEELERKLKHVEIDKVPAEDSSALFNNSEKATQTSAENDGVYEKYSCVYQSPIFEHSQPRCNSAGISLEELSDIDGSKEHDEDQMDREIQQLTEELKVIEADMLSNKISESNRCPFPIVDAKQTEMNDVNNINQMLQRKLREKESQLNKVWAQHAKELRKFQDSSSQLHELNKQLETDLAMSETRLAELQKHYDGLLATAESQLKEARDDLEESKRTADDLHHRLAEGVKMETELKKSSEKLNSQIVALNKKVEELEHERDSKEKEKSDLLVKLQAAQKEVDEQSSRVSEYLSINEELLEFAQKKENEVTSLRQQVQTLQHQVLEKTNVISELEMDLEKQQKDVNEMQKAYSSLSSEHEIVKSKLAENNVQLLQQEGTIATLTKQMADIMKGRDSMLEEAAQFHGYLQNAKYKEFELEGKLKQSASVIADLEKKIMCMENDSLNVKIELADMKKQNSLLQRLADEKEEAARKMKTTVNELRKKVQDLEEEVLLKEGQIAIISSQNGENYESF